MKKAQISIPLSLEDDQILTQFLGKDSDPLAAPSAEFSLDDDASRMYTILISVFTVTVVMLIAAWFHYGEDVRTAFAQRGTQSSRPNSHSKKD